MNPALSVILFTTLSGTGYGLWLWLRLRIAFLRAFQRTSGQANGRQRQWRRDGVHFRRDPGGQRRRGGFGLFRFECGADGGGRRRDHDGGNERSTIHG